MTTTLDRPRTAVRSWVVPVAALTAVVLRLPFLGRTPGADEAGFLMVGGQWHTGGGSLYGNYWVDRPPLLVWIFQLAADLGGVTALRLIGCIAVAGIVVGSATAAHLIAGQRAGRWAAIAAAGLCTSPLLGTIEVNGELLAAPFIVLSIVATLLALRSPDNRNTRLFALAAGASAMGAILIKQNLADAFVFGLLATIIAWHRGDIDGRRLGRILASAIGGALLAFYAMAFVTVLHGTSLTGVFDAMYPFRLQASRVQAAGGSVYSVARLTTLTTGVLTSGLALLLLAIGWGVASKRLRGSSGWALVAVIVFSTVSIASGGNYWAHYLVELIVPTAIALGVIIGRRQPLARPLVAGVVALAAITSLTWASIGATSQTAVLGHAIAASASTGDTIVTAYGHSNLDQQSGLESPYENLWSLPTKTRDPHLVMLNQVLNGPRAPTWFVTWRHLDSWGLTTDGVRATLASDYRVVGSYRGHTVYLHNGITRPPISTTAKDTTP